LTSHVTMVFVSIGETLELLCHPQPRLSRDIYAILLSEILRNCSTPSRILHFHCSSKINKLCGYIDKPSIDRPLQPFLILLQLTQLIAVPKLLFLTHSLLVTLHYLFHFHHASPFNIYCRFINHNCMRMLWWLPSIPTFSERVDGALIRLRWFDRPRQLAKSWWLKQLRLCSRHTSNADQSRLEDYYRKGIRLCDENS